MIEPITAQMPAENKTSFHTLYFEVFIEYTPFL